MSRVTDLRYSRSARTLTLTFEDGVSVAVRAELLRVRSPSAEVQGHGRAVLVSGKRDVGIADIKPVGHYAVQLIFDDGHDSGLYTWSYLRQLAEQQDALWDAYCEELVSAGLSRDPDVQVLKLDR